MQIRYLKTEVDIARELGIAVPHAIRVFTLADLDIDPERFLAELSASFERLAWDEYDVRREQVAFLREKFPQDAAWFDAFIPRYYAGEASIIDLIPYFRSLSVPSRVRFERLRSYRRRSIAQFVLTNRPSETWGAQWHIAQTHCTGFVQEVGTGDVRSIERIFDPAAAEVVENAGFQALLIAVARMTEDAQRLQGHEVRELTITFHQMGLVAQVGEDRTNAPEGLHQDGADYIVSALVLNRDGVTGGTSYVTGGDKQRRLLEVTLTPGMGIFQADRGSPLWHNVTPVQDADGNSQTQGVRNIFGFDINVRRD